jgi:hypothetical protein
VRLKEERGEAVKSQSALNPKTSLALSLMVNLLTWCLTTASPIEAESVNLKLFRD